MVNDGCGGLYCCGPPSLRATVGNNSRKRICHHEDALVILHNDHPISLREVFCVVVIYVCEEMYCFNVQCGRLFFRKLKERGE